MRGDTAGMVEDAAGSTRFGASWATPARAAAVLRASASAAGVPLGAAGGDDAVAAVLAAHTTLAAIGGISPRHIQHAGTDTIRAYAAALTRAAGRAAMACQDVTDEHVQLLLAAAPSVASLPDAVLLELEGAARWARTHASCPQQVLRAAAADVAAGARSPKLAAAAQLLSVLADSDELATL